MNCRALVLLLAGSLSCCLPSDDDFPERNSFVISNRAFKGAVQFQKLTTTTGFKILLRDSLNCVVDQTIFRYEPYRFDTSDVNQDGQTEIVVGLLKATRFDPGVKKRLFILRVDHNHLRPLWLGSKVCQELIDFKAISNGKIQTLERNGTGDYDIGSYYWQGFGLTLEKYTHHESSLSHAKEIFWQ